MPKRTFHSFAALIWLGCGGWVALAADREQPFCRSELIFPLEHWHNHGSCIVEMPRGGLLVCWFHGSGERNADDVKIEEIGRAHV